MKDFAWAGFWCFFVLMLFASCHAKSLFELLHQSCP